MGKPKSRRDGVYRMQWRAPSTRHSHLTNTFSLSGWLDTGGGSGDASYWQHLSQLCLGGGCPRPGWKSSVSCSLRSPQKCLFWLSLIFFTIKHSLHENVSWVYVRGFLCLLCGMSMTSVLMITIQDASSNMRGVCL